MEQEHTHIRTPPRQASPAITCRTRVACVGNCEINGVNETAHNKNTVPSHIR